MYSRCHEISRLITSVRVYHTITAAYSVENLYNGTHRHNFNAIVTDQDMADSYLPAFKTCVTKGRVSSLMCSYNSINGVPACADADLMTDKARGEWKFDGYITSDCGAIKDIWNRHNYTSTPEEACQVSLRAGNDLDCSDFYKLYLPSALESNVVTEEVIFHQSNPSVVSRVRLRSLHANRYNVLQQQQDIDIALGHLFRVQFRLGMFDPRELQVYTQVKKDVSL